jgi:hypothetical protein
MGKLIVLLGLAALVWKMALGRWPWESTDAARQQALVRARKLLGVRADADALLRRSLSGRAGWRHSDNWQPQSRKL